MQPGTQAAVVRVLHARRGRARLRNQADEKRLENNRIQWNVGVRCACAREEVREVVDRTWGCLRSAGRGRGVLHCGVGCAGI